MTAKKAFVAIVTLFTLSCNISCAGKHEATNFGASTGEHNQPQESPGGSAYPLEWESKNVDGKKWTEFVFELIQQQVPELIHGAEDVTLFCPGYFQLNTAERVNFWGLLISGIVKYESNFDPTSRMRETTMGIDPVTGQQVFSEGLLQLSYQDSRQYEFCDEFNWNIDRHLHPEDPKKTILDPYKNLHCGVKILAKQIRNQNRITVSKGVYWAVIRGDGKRNKIAQISALTKKMPGCM